MEFAISRPILRMMSENLHYPMDYDGLPDFSDVFRVPVARTNEDASCRSGVMAAGAVATGTSDTVGSLDRKCASRVRHRNMRGPFNEVEPVRLYPQDP